MEQFLLPEIIEEVLIRLPTRSLIRFRCVCKAWSRVISEHHFIRKHITSRRYLEITTALCVCVHSRQSMSLLGLHHHHAFPDPLLSFLPPSYSDDPYAFVIGSSCGGLIVCMSNYFLPSEWYVCNPTTKQYRRLLPPKGPKSICFLHLAFDPYLSSFYEVVSVEKTWGYQERMICFHVYYSEGMEWRTLSLNGTPWYNEIVFFGSAFFQGSIFWLSKDRSYLLALDVNKEKLRQVAVPNAVGALPGFVCYFGATDGCFNMIISHDSEGPSAQFDVWEMKSEDNWAFLYFVDLDYLLDSVPEYRNKKKVPLAIYRGVGEGSNKEDVVPVFFRELKKIIICHLKDNTFEVIHENVPCPNRIDLFPYSPSLLCV